MDEMKTAMKARDAFALSVLRMTISALNGKAIEKRGAGESEILSDEEVRTVIAKEAKRRDDAARLFDEGGRADLAEGERKERAFLAKYLPAQMSKDEVELAVKAVISAHPNEDFPAVMRAAMAELKGKADGSLVCETVKTLLSK